jgi:hypothetical protein
MRRRLLWIAPLLLGAAFLLSAYGGGDEKYASGSPGGYTGSPGDGQNCHACHSGSVANVTGWITSNIPASGYTPGATYTITATATGSGRKGFEISPQTPAGNLVGTLASSSGNHLCNNSKAVTQSSGVNSNPAVWTFSWTAPAAGSGSVTFYGAFAVTSSATKLTTMVVDEATSTPLTATATATPSAICAGQASQLNVSATGGNPPYTYSWTSDPAGFSSSLQSPIVNPSVTTIYSVQVSDGTNSTNSSVTVTVTAAPTASAGMDTVYCKDVTSIPLKGTASGYASVEWTTSGDGTFSSTSALESNYYPGTSDRNEGAVNLTLTASPVTPCAVPASSVRHIIFDPCTGLSGKPVNPGIVIEPNPTTGILYFGFNGPAGTEVSLVVFNDHGQQVLSRNITFSGQKEILDLSGFAKGLYFIKARSEEKNSISKIILY